MSVFALLMDATAGEGNAHPPGSRHHLLVLVRAASDEEALTEALIALTDLVWRDGEVKEIRPLDVAPSSIADPTLRDAATKAKQGHRSIIVYDQA
jgi:hypothetical protein